MNQYLTEKQVRVLTTIRDFFLENGYAPSLSELQLMLSINTKRGVVNHLESLEKKGYIIRTSEPRGIKLVEEEEYEYMIGIPILGYANAGQPLAIAEEDRLGLLHVDKSLLSHKSNLFALIVTGDSMNQRNIEGKPMSDGSYIIVSKDSDVTNGDAVVAVLDNSATVKSYKKSDDMIILYPESDNPKHQPIYLDQFSNSLINGKVIKVLERP
ncbi:MAG: LexA repressor [candidate division WS6 bacterium GW2011_GWF2_39_15]|uniref:LexA repressor n=1 Tax=candidate division WS6 bacterium GW2011_GWF2_39_15 TaxID=1619100 RepID=A0A0G0MSI5_9BACT|nr:MAG: LexA repressor [candidate division WS6 bacterium GW2011_GWF2_39_15]